MGLISLAEVKTRLGGGDTLDAEEDKLLALIEAASAAVETFCHRKFESASYTEYLDGNGRSDLVLRNRPVLNIASVRIDPTGAYGDGPNAFPADTELTGGVDYVLPRSDSTHSRSGLLKRIGGSFGGFFNSPYGGRSFGLTPMRSGATWPLGVGNIRVVYTAGYGEIPEDLKQAVFTLLAWMRRSGPLGGATLTTETLGEYSYTVGQLTNAATSALSTVGEMGSVRQLLASYKEFNL
ncbi:head-tail connector protein [Tuwongella immobilis]|uniref:Phage gp6-like head-tail connector protein n=1 Tax=Tuwongella immobilis TaxID=692036 RepID=A0A6C2YS43_9BACT|nr:phage head-tail connector protein [Tuwongella immobilis]VIP03969.1 Uncharacterized protein OS=Planctomyces maris DSM 8797 GN=PM8797T_10854 PE=4 SV=1 [Tuwongella immobilis]VTS05305.1 Uncharacterized protein OS=Planctomyces maris DSM 8797 GN=PM8797T_10854 PE=4 SV=1 [Tuwongella immobilis]